jgi:hypothetical protein
MQGVAFFTLEGPRVLDHAWQHDTQHAASCTEHDSCLLRAMPHDAHIIPEPGARLLLSVAQLRHMLLAVPLLSPRASESSAWRQMQLSTAASSHLQTLSAACAGQLMIRVYCLPQQAVQSPSGTTSVVQSGSSCTTSGPTSPACSRVRQSHACWLWAAQMPVCACMTCCCTRSVCAAPHRLYRSSTAALDMRVDNSMHPGTR